MHTVIIGAGLSGPLLAQGLCRQGIAATLVESRTPTHHRNNGYRIHLDPQGDLALRRCLDPSAYELVRRTAGVSGSGVRVLDTDLQVLHEVLVSQPEDHDQGRHLTVDRQTLREILLDGLDDVISYGVSFVRYEIAGDRVWVDLDDGSTLEADLLVGADGSGSRVRAQRLPDLQVITVGQVNIFGRTTLTPQTRQDIPAAALDGFCTVVSPDGRAMSLAAHRFANPPQAAADELRPGLQLSSDHDYLMWVLTVPHTLLPPGGLPEDLVPYVAEQVGQWQQSLARLVRASEPGSVHAATVRTSRRPAPWTPQPVTLLGDAAHPMIPAGIGAAVALADAARLTDALAAVTATRSLTEAVADYERDMLRYGFDAVEASEQRLG